MIDAGCKALIVGAARPELSSNVGRVVRVRRYVREGDQIGECPGAEVLAAHDGWLCEFVGRKGWLQEMLHGIPSFVRSRATVCREEDLVRVDSPRGRRPRRHKQSAGPALHDHVSVRS